MYTNLTVAPSGSIVEWSVTLLISNVDLTLGGMEQKRFDTLQGKGEERVEWMGMGGGEERMVG